MISDEIWQRMSTELASIGRLPSEGDRQTLSSHCQIYQQLIENYQRPKPAEMAKQWAAAAKAAGKLGRAMRVIEENSDQFDLNSFADAMGMRALSIADIDSFARRATWLAGAHQNGPKVSGRENVAENNFANLILNFWVSCGGEVKRSVNPETQFSCGPLIRFVQAAFEATGKPRTVESIAEMIRKYKRIQMS